MAGSNEAIPGWWLASDGRWYPPTDLPSGWVIGADGRAVRAPEAGATPPAGDAAPADHVSSPWSTVIPTAEGTVRWAPVDPTIVVPDLPPLAPMPPLSSVIPPAIHEPEPEPADLPPVAVVPAVVVEPFTPRDDLLAGLGTDLWDTPHDPSTAGAGVLPELADGAVVAASARGASTRGRDARRLTLVAAILVLLLGGAAFALRGGGGDDGAEVLGAVEARGATTRPALVTGPTSSTSTTTTTTAVDPAKLSSLGLGEKAPVTTTTLRIFGGLAPGTGSGGGFVPAPTVPRSAPFAPTTTVAPPTTAVPGTTAPATTRPPATTVPTTQPPPTTSVPSTTSTSTTSTSTTSTSTTTTSTTTTSTTTTSTSTTTSTTTTTIPPTTTAAPTCSVTSPSQPPREGNSFTVVITSNRPGAAATATVDFSSSSNSDRTLTGTTNGAGGLTFSPSVSVPGSFGGRTVTISVTVGGASCGRTFTVAQNNNNN